MIFINRPGLVVSQTNQFIIQQLVEYFTAHNMAVYTAHIEDILQKQPFDMSEKPNHYENKKINDFRKKTVELSKQGIKGSTSWRCLYFFQRSRSKSFCSLGR